jgi:hypothetical protein
MEPIRKKNCLWWPCFLTDWDKMSNLYKRTFHRCFLSSFGSFGHAVSEEIVRNRQIRNKYRLKFFSSETAWPNDPKLGRKHLWAVLYKEYSFHSNSINKHGPNQKQVSPVVAMFVNGSERNEYS